jgi:hypothetical protein
MHADLAEVKRAQTVRRQQELARRQATVRWFAIAAILAGLAIVAWVWRRRFNGW